MIIDDGTGSGRKLKIDDENRAVVKVDENQSILNYESSDGQAYEINTSTTANTLTNTATGGGKVYIENDDADKKLFIDSVVISSDTAGLVAFLTKNPTLASVANNNAFTPVNVNFTLGRPASGTFHTWDAGAGWDSYRARHDRPVASGSQ